MRTSARSPQHRWETIDSVIHHQLNRYVGTIQINQLGQDRWSGYPIWHRKDAIKRKAKEDDRKKRLAEAKGRAWATPAPSGPELMRA